MTIEALRSGAVDAALMFSSDGAIASNRFVLLRDDRHLQPADNVVPVVRTEVIQHWPQLGPLLDRVSADLTTGGLRAMNAAVEIEGRSPATVAAAWLRSHDLEGEA